MDPRRSTKLTRSPGKLKRPRVGELITMSTLHSCLWRIQTIRDRAETHKMMLEHYQQTKNMLVFPTIKTPPDCFKVNTDEKSERVSVTEEAAKVIEALRKEHGDLMFHQSGGCCDGSSPMCFKAGTFWVGANDVYLGDVAGCPFYMSRAQYEYWKTPT